MCYASEQGLCPKNKNHPIFGWMIIIQKTRTLGIPFVLLLCRFSLMVEQHPTKRVSNRVQFPFSVGTLIRRFNPCKRHHRGRWTIQPQIIKNHNAGRWLRQQGERSIYEQRRTNSIGTYGRTGKRFLFKIHFVNKKIKRKQKISFPTVDILKKICYTKYWYKGKCGIFCA